VRFTMIWLPKMHQDGQKVKKKLASSSRPKLEVF
jgi:hypothetical protein